MIKIAKNSPFHKLIGLEANNYYIVIVIVITIQYSLITMIF